MVTNFENITHALTAEEEKLIPLLMNGLCTKTKDNPIKGPEIISKMNAYAEGKGLPALTEPRLRKCINHIRSNSLLPIIATSKGYYVSDDPAEIRDQVNSLRERAESILRSAAGLEKFASQ